mgnify:CR=1 FL=1
MKNSSLNKTTLSVEGMTCNNCAAGIKKHLENNSVVDVNVNFSLGEVSFNIDQKNSISKVISLIEQIGFKVKIDNQKINKFSKVEILFLISLIFTLPLILHMFLDHSNILYNPIIQVSLCIPVYLIGIHYFGKSAVKSLKIGVPNMDVLIFIGSTSAFVYSLYGWLAFYGEPELRNYLFFETTATIITLVLLGNVLEHKSVKKTTSAISDLSKIQKTIAKKKINNEIQEIDFDVIQNGRQFDLAVDENYFNDAKNMLAIRGIPSSSVKGFAIFDEASNLGATEFDKRIQLQRALSGEMELAITQFEAIDDAQVKLVMPEQRLFDTTEIPVTASVLIRPSKEHVLTDSVIYAIIRLISNGIENLCREGFSGSVYLYKSNWDSAFSNTSCACVNNTVNDMKYYQLNYFDSIDVYKIDINGNQLWSQNYTGDGGVSVYETLNGNYVVCGTTSWSGNSGGDICLIKTDNSGNQQWSKKYGGSSHDVGYSVQQHHVDKLPGITKPYTKRTRRFLIGDSIEGWADAIKVLVFEKSCIQNNCKTKKIKSKLEGELKLAILKKAALFEREDFKKFKETKGKDRAKSLIKKK